MNPTSAVPVPETVAPLPTPSPVLKSISVGGDDTVWGVLSDNGAVVESTAASQPWLPIPAAGPASAVCGSRSEGALYALFAGLPSTTTLTPGSPWTAMPSAGATLFTNLWAGALGDGTPSLWATDSSRTAYNFVNTAPHWIQLNWTADVIAPSPDGSLFRLDGGVVYTTEGETWVQITTPEAMSDISAGAAGDLWAVGVSGSIYHYDGVGEWATEGGPYPKASISAGEDGTVWLLDGQVIRAYDPTSGSFGAVTWTDPASPVAISVSTRDQAWVIDANGQIFQYTEYADLWDHVSGLEGGVSQVSAASAGDVWLLDSAGNLSRNQRAGSAWTTTTVTGLQATTMAAGKNETLAIDATGKVWSCQASPPTVVSSTPALASVAVEPGGSRAGLDASGVVYSWDAASGSWAPLPAPTEPIKDLALAEGGAIFALGASGALWLYLGQWVPVAPAGTNPLQRIAIHDPAHFWGIAADGSPVDLSTHGDGPAPAVAGHQLGWDTESVTDETASTHLWIVNRAATLAQGQGAEGQAVSALVRPTSGTTIFRQNLCQGLYDADFKAEYNNTSWGVTTYKSHFYDPDSGQNWVGDTSPTAVTQGVSFFNDAVAKYKAGDLAGAGYSLGLALHYFTDLTQPMHAANFTWLSSMLPGYHSAFEVYAMGLQAQVNPPATYTPGTSGVDPQAYLINAAKRSKQRYYRTLCPPDQMSNYPWYTDYLKGIARQWVPTILHEAITLTSQFLVAWKMATDGDSSSPA